MPGINVSASIAERQLSFPWLTGFIVVPAKDFVSAITGESCPRVELYAPTSRFIQPKGAKHAPKVPSIKVLNDRAWKATKATRFECGCGVCMSCDDAWKGDRKPRSEAKRLAIAEELHHARELDDHDAVMEDGFASSADHEPITYTTRTTPSTTEAHKEAPTMKNAKSTATNRNGSIAQPRPSGRRMSKGLPARTDCAIRPSMTLVPNPESPARKAEDARFLAVDPVDPTTRKAAPVLPTEPFDKGEWSVDDIKDDLRLVRLGA